MFINKTLKCVSCKKFFTITFKKDKVGFIKCVKCLYEFNSILSNKVVKKCP